MFKSFQLPIVLQHLFFGALIICFIGKISPDDFLYFRYIGINLSISIILFLLILFSCFLYLKQKIYFEKIFYYSPWFCLIGSVLFLTINPSLTWIVIPTFFFIQWCVVWLFFVLENRFKWLTGLYTFVNSIITFGLSLDFIYFNITQNHIRIAHLMPIIIGTFETLDFTLIMYVVGLTITQIIIIGMILIFFFSFPFVLALKYDSVIVDFKKTYKDALLVFFVSLILIFIYNPLVRSLPLPETIFWYSGTKFLSISDLPNFSDLESQGIIYNQNIKINRDKLSDRSSYSWNCKDIDRKNIVFLTIESWRRDALDYMPFVKSLTEKGIYLANHYTPSNDSLGGTTAFYYSIFPPYISKQNYDSTKTDMKTVLKMPAYISLDKFAAFLKPSNWITFLKKSDYTLIRILDSITLEYPEYYAKKTKEAEHDLNMLPKEFDGGYSERSLDILLEYMKKPGLKIMETVLYDTHYNYTFPPEYEILKPIVNYNTNLFASFTKENQIGMRNRYYNAAIYVDTMLKAFFDKVEKAGLMKNTIFIIIGDHGECLGEDGSFFHASGAHENQFKTTAIIYGSEIPSYKIQGITTHEDIIPTIASFVGFSSKDTLGEDAFKSSRQFVISYDITKDQNIIIRHKEYMNIFELLNDGSLKWKSITRNSYVLDSFIFELLLSDDHKDLSELIVRDRKLIADYFNRTK
jgi:hypothetical protein